MLNSAKEKNLYNDQDSGNKGNFDAGPKGIF